MWSSPARAWAAWLRLSPLVAGAIAGWRYTGSVKLGLAMGVVAMIVAGVLHSLALRFTLRPEVAFAKARQRIEEFARTHMHWHLRLYRTPAGWRCW